MNNQQRVFILVTLCGVAIALHFWHCKWLVGGSGSPNILSISKGTWAGGSWGIATREYAPNSAELWSATLWGIVAPLLLIVLAVFLLLGWKKQWPFLRRLKRATRRAFKRWTEARREGVEAQVFQRGYKAFQWGYERERAELELDFNRESWLKGWDKAQVDIESNATDSANPEQRTT